MKRAFENWIVGARNSWAEARIRAARGAGEPPPFPASRDDDRPPVTCIVFSKDRAMQLDACLRSIERLSPYGGPIVVIYRATNPAFGEGYEALDVGPRVRLVAESDFRRDVLDVLSSGADYFAFHTDDDIFFRTISTAPIPPPGFAAFSLRLGTNTTQSYALNRSQKPPAMRSREDLVAWDWTRADGDFGYPLSLNGHVLSAQLLLRLLRRARFSNPNHLEAELHVRRHLVPPWMLAFRESSVVSIPANIVTSTHTNRAGTDPELSPSALNERFLAGQRIDAGAMDFSSVRGAHQEIPLVFAAGPAGGDR